MYFKKTFLLILFLTFCAQATYAGNIGSDYGPNRIEFLELCKNIESESKLNNGVNSICFNYFMGIRDGYLRSAYEAAERAALYYWFKGELPPGAELEYKYNLEVSKARDNAAYEALYAHRVDCMRKDDPIMVLKEFIAYLNSIKRKNGVTKHFNEFAIRKYSGKCS